MDTPSFPKIEPQTTTSKVYDYLKQSILGGSLPPGTRLLEAQIAEQMGVSRSPVREATRLLNSDGLVELRTNQGTFVRSLSVDDVQEIYTARSLIEGYAASLAADRAMPEDVARLRQIARSAVEAARRGDFGGTVVADFDLHRMIWEMADHKLIYDILSRLEVQIRMFMSVQAPLFTDLIVSVQDHKTIVQAIEDRDAEAAKAAIRHHINEAGSLTVSRLAGQVGEQS